MTVLPQSRAFSGPPSSTCLDSLTAQHLGAEMEKIYQPRANLQPSLDFAGKLNIAGYGHADWAPGSFPRRPSLCRHGVGPTVPASWHNARSVGSLGKQSATSLSLWQLLRRRKQKTIASGSGDVTCPFSRTSPCGGVWGSGVSPLRLLKWNLHLQAAADENVQSTWVACGRCSNAVASLAMLHPGLGVMFR